MKIRRDDLLVCLVLATLIAIVFGQTIEHDFVGYDDPLYVTDQPVVQRGLTAEGLAWAFRHGADEAYWTPITYLSHMLDVELFGMRPGLHHLSSVVLHAVNSILLFLVLQAMTRQRWPAALVAAWFAVHPLHVESVAWVAERKDLVSTFFFLLCLATYTAYARHGGRWRYALLLVLFTLGLMSKPMLVTLPALLLVLDFWPLRRAASWKRLAVEKLPLLAMSLGISLFAITAQQEAGAMRTLEQFPLGFRVSNAIVSYARYIGKTVWPMNLAVFYPPPSAWPVIVVAASAAVLITITLLAVARWRTMPYLLAGWLWFLGSLLPVIGLVQVGRQAMADRYSYIPHIGLFMMFAWTAAQRAARPDAPRRAIAAAAVVLTLAFALRAADQTRHWRNTTTLFDHALAVTPENTITLNQAGNARLREGDAATAEALYRRALELDPNYGMAHLNLGNLLARRREFDPAAAHFEAAIRWRGTMPRAHLGLAIARTGLKQYDLADASFREALRLAPHLEDAQRAWARSRQERADPASRPSASIATPATTQAATATTATTAPPPPPPPPPPPVEELPSAFIIRRSSPSRESSPRLCHSSCRNSAGRASPTPSASTAPPAAPSPPRRRATRLPSSSARWATQPMS